MKLQKILRWFCVFWRLWKRYLLLNIVAKRIVHFSQLFSQVASVVESALAHAWAIVRVRESVDGLSPAIGLCWGQDSWLCRGVGSLRLTFFVECAFLAIVLFLFAEHFVKAFRIYLLILLGGHSARRGLRLHEVSDVRVFLVELLLELGDARHGSISRLASLFLYSNEHKLNLVTV